MRKSALTLIFLLISVNFYGQSDYEIVQIEGFYISGWETSLFYEIKDNNAEKFVWLEFDKEIELSESLKKNLKKSENGGLLLRVTGRKRTGGNYGHLGIAKSEIIVTEINSYDISQTFQEYLEEQRK